MLTFKFAHRIWASNQRTTLWAFSIRTDKSHHHFSKFFMLFALCVKSRLQFRNVMIKLVHLSSNVNIMMLCPRLLQKKIVMYIYIMRECYNNLYMRKWNDLYLWILFVIRLMCLFLMVIYKHLILNEILLL